MDAANYKHIVLGLIFLKYVSDAFEERQQELRARFLNEADDYYLLRDGYDTDEEYNQAVQNELEVRDYYTEKNVFWVPREARWDALKTCAVLTLASATPTLSPTISTPYGYAKYLRDALPYATFIGFTGMPIETTDHNTRSVFGDYVSVYDIQDAVDDGATVPIYYESRLAKVDLNHAEIEGLSEEMEEVIEDEEDTANRERTKGK